MLLTATPTTTPAPNAAAPAPRTDSSPANSPTESADKSFSDSLAQSVARHAPAEVLPTGTKAQQTRVGTAKGEGVEDDADAGPVTEQDLATQVIGWAEHMVARRDAKASTPRVEGEAKQPLDRRAVATQSMMSQPLAADALTSTLQDKASLTSLLGQMSDDTGSANPAAPAEKRGTKGTRPTNGAERHAAGSARKGADMMTGLSQPSGAPNGTDSTDIRLAANKPLATDVITIRTSAAPSQEPTGNTGSSALQTAPFTQMLHEAATDIAPRTAHIGVPVGHPQWGHSLGQQLVAWSHHARTGEMKAELRLDPPDLGPMRVALTIADGVASASFVSAHAAVRSALEQAMPQLHAALASSGISLGQTHVGENGTGASGQGTQDQGSGRQFSGTHTSESSGTTSSALVTPNPQRSGHGLLDVFA